MGRGNIWQTFTVFKRTFWIHIQGSRRRHVHPKCFSAILHVATTNKMEPYSNIQGGSKMTRTHAACLHTNQSRSYLNHLVYPTRRNVTQFISVNCSTCFWWYLHPSSGAHTTVSTASGICQSVTATCRYRGRVETVYLPRQRQVARTVWQIPDVVGTVLCSWWWVGIHPKHVEQFTEINKLYNVASCWSYFGTHLRSTEP